MFTSPFARRAVLAAALAGTLPYLSVGPEPVGAKRLLDLAGCFGGGGSSDAGMPPVTAAAHTTSTITWSSSHDGPRSACQRHVLVKRLVGPLAHAPPHLAQLVPLRPQHKRQAAALMDMCMIDVN